MRRLPLYFVWLILLGACVQEQANKDITVLLALQEQEQVANLTKDVLLFMEMFHDTVCQIKNGTVSYHTKKEMAERFTLYFGIVDFIKWQDSHPPVVTLSEDHSMAHILVRKRVELMVKDSASTVEKTDFAWTELWRKKQGRWKLYSITSTDKPGE
jgi:hypothetical protein